VSEAYIGEIRMFGGNFAPNGWMFCEGQLLPISENDVLFQLLGTTYGGDGEQTFALPDLRGRLPVHAGNDVLLGEKGGTESVTVTTQQIPGHTHPAVGSSANATTANAQGNVLAGTPTYTPYIAANPNTAMAASSVGAGGGGGQPHDNVQPYLCVNFIISLYGVFPPQG
jgi:microcystin-dependent protein